MDDLISRQAVLDFIDSMRELVENGRRMIRQADTLPSAQPEPLTINFARELDRETIEKVKESMKNAPVLIMAVNDDSAEPERKKGRWEDVTDGIYVWKVCDQCGEKPLWNEWKTDRDLSSFCPTCGAEMRGEEG